MNRTFQLLAVLVTVFLTSTLCTNAQLNWARFGLDGQSVSNLSVIADTLIAETSDQGIWLNVGNASNLWVQHPALKSGITNILGKLPDGSLMFSHQNGQSDTLNIYTSKNWVDKSSWSMANNGLPVKEEPITAYTSNNTSRYISFGNEIYAYGSGSWNRIDTSGFPDTAFVVSMNIDRKTKNLLVGTDVNGLWVYNGSTWANDTVCKGFAIKTIDSWEDGTQFVGTYFIGAFVKGPSGTTWDSLHTGLTQQFGFYSSCQAFGSTSQDTLLLGTDNGMFVLGFGGIWSKLNTGLTGDGFDVFSVLYFKGMPYIGTGNGVYRLQIGSGVHNYDGAVSGLASFNILTNRSDNTVRIAYTLARPTYLTVRIFDAHGNEIAQPEFGIREAGNHTVQAMLPEETHSGMYFVRLEANGGMITRQFVLTR